MMVKTSTNWVAMTDEAIIGQIGQFVKKNRISKNRTQTQVAEAAGMNRWTISQIENGEAIALTSLIQILRALDSLYALDSFKIQNQISPLQAVKLQPKERQRASGSSKSSKPKSNW
jgi:transcriptional regulator with XRE-family HTH domain